MNDWLLELVELYEYRVADIMAGQPPRGDRNSLGRLREALVFADGMDSNLRRRFMNTERAFREFQRKGGKIPAGTRREQTKKLKEKDADKAVQQLTKRLWQSSAEQWVLARLLSARFEPRLVPLRLLATVLDNIERKRRRETPGPLMSLKSALQQQLTSPEAVSQLASRLLELLVSAPGRQQLRGALLSVRKQTNDATDFGEKNRQVSAYIFSDPDEEVDIDITQQLLFSDHYTPEEIDLLLLVQAERGMEQVLSRWAKQTNPEKDYLQATKLVAGWAEPEADTTSKAGTTEAAIDKSVTLAALPLPPTSSPVPEQPYALQWGDWALTLVYHAGPNKSTWTLTANRGEYGEQTLTLRQDLPQHLQHWTVQLGPERLQILTGGNYLLLRREQAGSHALALAAGRARLGSYLVQPAQAFAAMRLARAAALTLRGKSLAGHDYSPESSRKYLVTAPHALGQLAGRGMEVLLTLSSQVPREELIATLQQTAAATGLEAEEGWLLAELLLNPLPELLLGNDAVEQAGLTRTGPFAVLGQPNLERSAEQGWQLAAGGITAHIQPAAQSKPSAQPNHPAQPSPTQLGPAAAATTPAPWVVTVASETLPLEEQIILPLEEGILLLAQHGGLVAASIVPKPSDTEVV